MKSSVLNFSNLSGFPSFADKFLKKCRFRNLWKVHTDTALFLARTLNFFHMTQNFPKLAFLDPSPNLGK